MPKLVQPSAESDSVEVSGRVDAAGLWLLPFSYRIVKGLDDGVTC
jgi:hypothetical protein